MVVSRRKIKKEKITQEKIVEKKTGGGGGGELLEKEKKDFGCEAGFSAWKTTTLPTTPQFFRHFLKKKLISFFLSRGTTLQSTIFDIFCLTHKEEEVWSDETNPIFFEESGWICIESFRPVASSFFLAKYQS